jgi:putative DNA primase/helicase
MTVAELLAKHGINLPSTAPGRHYTTCPHCSAGRASKEHRAAKVLGVTIEADGGVHWGCNHCSWTGPEKGAGKDGNGRGGAQHAATYDYTDESGALLFQKVRNPPGRDPRFWLRRPDGKGGWINGTKGVNTGILYHALGVARAIAEGRVVAVVEGEKDANSVRALGIIATCNAHGASELGKRPKWTRAHSEQLRGADIVVLNDNDGAGYAHANATCNMSLLVAKRVRRLDLAKHWPEIPKGGDVSDWLAAGHTGEELAALIEQAPDYEPPPGAKEKAPPPDSNGIDDAAELERLARLAPLDYERARKDAGKRLGISRLSLLDALVKAKRAELGLDGADDKQGHAIEFATPEPWPNPVDGAEALDEIAKAIGAHVIMAEHSRDACALWAAHTFLTDCTMISPRLAFTSPTKGCGKTTALDVMGQIVLRPLAAANVSPSAIFRVVEACHPTLLIDEADSFLKDNEELRGVLNSGHRRGGGVLRTVAVRDDFEVRSFSTYGAIAIALIGQLPGTLADRSVPIALTRRKRDEAITSFRLDRVGHLVVLARKLARWAADNTEAVAGVEPEMPVGLYNRAADNWRPLLAIAMAAGGDWLARGHKAAIASAGADVDEVSRLELLLGDTRDVFDGLTSDTDRISSAHLIERLCEIVPSPWGEYGKRKKPLTQNQLARLLKPLGIVSQVLRIGAETPSGYFRHQFKEAWERFLAPTGQFKPQHLNKYDEIRTSDAFQSSTAETDVEVAKCEKSNNDGLCLGVEVGKGDLGEWARASDGNGLAPGLSQRTIAEFAEDYTETTYRLNREGGDIDSAALDADLRRRLAEMVLPEFIETEFERVMAEVFRV